LIALGLISIRLSLNQKGLYFDLTIGLLVLLSAIVVSVITINRKINKPIQDLQDATPIVSPRIFRNSHRWPSA